MTELRPSQGHQGPWQPERRDAASGHLGAQYGADQQRHGGRPHEGQQFANPHHGGPHHGSYGHPYGAHQQPYGPGGDHQPGYGPPAGVGGPPGAEPRNGLAMPALILGIITLALSPLPFLNQAGILVGLVGAGLGIAALVIGLRRGVRVVLAGVGLGLSILGLISSFWFTSQFVDSLNQISSGVSGASGTSGAVSGSSAGEAAPAAQKVTFSLSGTAKRARINYSYDGSSGGGQEVSVPWTKEMTSTGSSPYASLSAYTDMGSKGTLTCTITAEDGTVLSTKTATSQGGDFGSANVNCSAF